ncbi:MAG: penicillin-binding protein [Trichlorobacter sp.]|jgi:cell division protein FtsI (penicillin-binding protein 3)
MRDQREKWARVRIILLASLFACGFFAVSARVFYLQVLRHEQLVKLAERQHNRTVPLVPGRGGIYDRNGAPLAVSLEMDSLYAEPQRIKDADGTATALAQILGEPRQELLKKLNSDRGFVWLERRLTPELADRIKQLKLAGIGFVKESKRFYPNFEVASHVLGFTGLDPEGLEGIERRYDAAILGNTGYLVTERDALGRDVALHDAVVKDASPGRSLVLTLDKNIQYLAEKELAKAVQESGAKSGMAVVAEPATGKILAMANYPTFNPNAYNRYPVDQLRNRSVADSFEPGSTFKIFLMSAALEEKVVRPQDLINCEGGSYSFGGRTIRDDHPQGRISVTDVLKYSSNIGSAKIGFKIGEDRYYRYLKAFGFGEKTGVDLPGETGGGLRPVSRWYGSDLATIAFGQGVSASAIQLVTAVSAVANGGLLMKPYLVERITDDAGRELQAFQPQVVRRVISSETAANVTRMLEGVVTTGGTGTRAAVEGFRVAGKTGTAQKVDPLTKGYSGTKRIASFIGFVPADKPLLTILVVVDEPSSSPYGGVVAAPAFREIAFNSLCYLKSTNGMAGGSKRAGLQAKAPPPPPAAQPAQAPHMAMAATSGEGGSIDVAGAGTVMPDFRGMSMRRVLQVMEKRQINIQLRGSGRVIEQYPLPGQVIRGADEIWVRLVPTA